LHTSDYCREIETYLCQKNDGHLIRVVGPAFDMVSRWATDGIPVKVAFSGIDRYFERYYRKGPRRRPVRIDFCEADVLEVFDEWRRAVGLSKEMTAAGGPLEHPDPAGRRATSVPAHLERAVMRLTNARATGVLPASVDPLIDRLAGELDTARASGRGVRGDARRALLARLTEADAELLQTARQTLTAADLEEITAQAEAELTGFRERMSADAYSRARLAATDRLIRERFNLPTLALD
jgi:hypothetical protein